MTRQITRPSESPRPKAEKSGIKNNHNYLEENKSKNSLYYRAFK